MKCNKFLERNFIGISSKIRNAKRNILSDFLRGLDTFVARLELNREFSASGNIHNYCKIEWCARSDVSSLRMLQNNAELKLLNM